MTIVTKDVNTSLILNNIESYLRSTHDFTSFQNIFFFCIVNVYLVLKLLFSFRVEQGEKDECLNISLIFLPVSPCGTHFPNSGVFLVSGLIQ